jgi:lon-related putative ATP-dependent protease
MSVTELSPEQLRLACDPAEFGCTTTEEVQPLDEIVGQPRATRAIDFGIEIQAYGFHIYALGPAGAGKTTTVRQFLERKAIGQPVPGDWVYVNNFTDPYRPRALHLPAGRGGALRQDMTALNRQIEAEIPRAFESEAYEDRRQQILNSFQEQRRTEFTKLEELANQRGFALLEAPMGVIVAPMLHGQVLTPDQYSALDPSAREQFESHRGELQQALERSVRVARDLEKEARARLQQLDREVASFAIGHLIDDLKEKYADCNGVPDFLEAVRQDIIDHIDDFRQPEKPEGAPTMPAPTPSRSPTARYQVNLIVDSSQTKGAPVIVERNPTFANLIGRVEQRVEFGALVTDFTMLKGGALHRANGGYLILDAINVLKNPFAWDALKRSLRDGQVRPEEMAAELRALTTTTLEPEPIPLDAKVILIGDARTYYLLYELDEEFRELFKVLAEFDTEMPRVAENLAYYARFVAQRVREEKLHHFEAGALAQVIEESSRQVEDQQKLSTRFSDVADLLREASYWASENGHQYVTAADVQQTLNERIYRSNRIEERIREMIQDGSIRVDTEGAVLSQINGISILELGDYEFGKPSRITVATYAGKDGVINIEREVKLSGPIHDKGMLILQGYLGSKYAQQHPLSLSASVVFEQAYEEVEGDSASSTELYAILSSLAGLPIDQGIAVTGSVDQAGNVQPVGGATRKIEGFYDVCRVKGLTGKQGVIMPAQNVRNLMLRQDVVEAVRQGQFHIWPVRTIDDGISLLTGVPAGERQPDGSYPEGTVNARVTARLKELSEIGKGEEEEEGDKGRGNPSPEERRAAAEFVSRWRARAVPGQITGTRGQDFTFRPDGSRREFRLFPFGHALAEVPTHTTARVIVQPATSVYWRTRSRRHHIRVSQGDLTLVTGEIRAVQRSSEATLVVDAGISMVVALLSDEPAWDFQPGDWISFYSTPPAHGYLVPE